MRGPVRAIGAPDDGLPVTLKKRASELGLPASYGILHLSDLSKRLLLGVRGRSRRALEAAVGTHTPEQVLAAIADRAGRSIDQEVEPDCFVMLADSGAPTGAEERLHFCGVSLPV